MGFYQVSGELSEPTFWLTSQLGPFLVSLFVTVVGGLILRGLQPSAKIMWSKPHEYSHLIRVKPHTEQLSEGTSNEFDGTKAEAAQASPTTTLIRTGSVFVQNVGRMPANGVEVIYNWEPENFELWPVIPYQTEMLPDRRLVVRVPNLGPKEWFRIESISGRELPAVVRVRSCEGEASPVPMAPQRIYPQWFNISAFILMLVGVFSIIYLVTYFVFELLN